MGPNLSQSFQVYGRVQGVGFRAFAQRSAHELGIDGWIMNCRDLSVYGEVIGPKESLNLFFDMLRRGPRHSLVERLELAPPKLAASNSETGLIVRTERFKDL